MKDNLLVIAPGFPCKDWENNHTFIKSQVDELSSSFKEIYVIVQKPWFPESLKNFPFIPEEIRNYSLFKNYNYKNVKVFYATYFILPFNFLKNYRSFALFNSIDNIIIKNNLNFKYIHSHFLWPCGDIGVKLKNKYKKQTIVTAHGFDVYNLPFVNNFWFNKCKFILDNSDKVITVSKKNQNILKKISSKKTELINNGFSEEIFYYKDKNISRKKLKIDSNKKILVTVGNLKEIKNQETLIKAISHLKSQDVICYIIGSGSLEKKLKHLIFDLKLKNKVFLLGAKTQKEISLFLSAADLFILPSLNEGNPTVVFESLGCGLPVLSNDVGGVKEIISDSNFGLINSKYFKNEVKFASFIEKGLNKKWDYKLISNYAFEYSWKNISKKILEVYEK